MTEVVELRCPACLLPLIERDRFCERCGARVAGAQTRADSCARCGAVVDAIDDDGYCSICGVRAVGPRDRVELDLATAAGVSDRGRVARRNEDAFHLERVAGGVAAVVCDGISSASAGDAAARDAARAAGAVLTDALSGYQPDLRTVAVEAVGAAYAAVERVPWTASTGRAMPSCTLVCAVLCATGEMAVASVGDSRAYWVDSDGARQLTVDDSWAQEQVADGRLTPAEALRDSRSHSITHWIGPDAPLRPPRLALFDVAGPGRLLLCSDGLWNYLPDEAELAEQIGALPCGASPAAVARALTDAALARGGRDNVTVVVVDSG